MPKVKALYVGVTYIRSKKTMQGQEPAAGVRPRYHDFLPDGRLYQVEYAREAVKRGTASIGVRTAEGVVLLVDKRTDPRSSRVQRRELHKVDDHVGAASAGHVADARQLIDFARQQSQVERVRCDEPIGVRTLTKEVTDHIQQYTQVGARARSASPSSSAGSPTANPASSGRTLRHLQRVEGRRYRF